MKNAFNDSAAFELLLMSQQQIHENIKFADQKAAAVIGASGALMALIFPLIEQKVPFALALGLPTCLMLALGIGLAFLVVKPRGDLNRRHGPGVIDSARIAQYSLPQFHERLTAMSNEALLAELRTFIYDRAHIDQRKYRYLRWSLRVSAAAWLASLLFAVWAKVHS